jgi:prevent-host-death family protein
MDIGIRELKQHLSEYLERAANGELIQVTDRGVPKAVLGPLPGRFRLDQGTAEGWVSKGAGGSLTPIRRVRSRRRIADVLAEDRGE